MNRHRLHLNRFERRKIETQLGRVTARAESLRAGLEECLVQCRKRDDVPTRVPDGAWPRSHSLRATLDALTRDLGIRPAGGSEGAGEVRSLLERAGALSEAAAAVARAAFATGALCDHERNRLYRPRSGRFEACGLSPDRLRRLADDLAVAEQRVNVLLFAICTDRSYADALRVIHPRASRPDATSRHGTA